MSSIYNISGFDTVKFEGFSDPSESDLYECLAKEDLLEDSLQSEIRDARIFISQDKNYTEGFIDHLIMMFQDKGPLEEHEKEALGYLKKASEHTGNLVQKHANSDPYFFGYLNVEEVNSLTGALSKVVFEEDEHEKELLVGVLEKAKSKNTGIIYWMTP